MENIRGFSMHFTIWSVQQTEESEWTLSKMAFQDVMCWRIFFLKFPLFRAHPRAVV